MTFHLSGPFVGIWEGTEGHFWRDGQFKGVWRRGAFHGGTFYGIANDGIFFRGVIKSGSRIEAGVILADRVEIEPGVHIAEGVRLIASAPQKSARRKIA